MHESIERALALPAVGISQGLVDGVTPTRANEVRQAAQDFTEPPVTMSVQQIDSPAGETVLVLKVESGDQAHVTSKGECYLRIGDESRRLTFAQQREFGYDRGMSTFDAHGVDADLSDLDQGLCQAYQRTIGSSTIEGMLRARDLVAGDGRSTVAAWLLFSERPQMIFPSAHVRVLKYADRERGSGSRMTLMAGHDIRFDGTLGHQINSAIKQVEEWLPRLQRLDSDGVFRDTAIIPTEAWKEGIINAVAHRSYSMHGDHIRIEIFPNRIEISNPGRFPGLVDLSEPTSIIRTARNPRIVRVLADMGIARELGEGISRMFDHMREAELVNPIYRQSSMGVTLILLDEPLPTRLTRPIKPAATRVFAAMREAGQPLGSAQVAELVGISKPTAIRHLNALREDGLVTWSGSKPNDPNATWALT